MAQYIDKSALVAEIERRIKVNKELMLGLRNIDCYQGKVDTLNGILSFLDTLEVKEMGLEKEAERFVQTKEFTEIAKQETIEKACSWLSNMSLEDMVYKYDGFDTSEGWYKMIEDFKKIINVILENIMVIYSKVFGILLDLHQLNMVKDFSK